MPVLDSSDGPGISPLIVYTNAWPGRPDRDWHYPIAHAEWDASVEAWLQWFRRTAISLTEPIPAFSQAWIYRALGETATTGIVVPRVDRVGRPSFLVAVARHPTTSPPGPIVAALQQRFGPLARREGEADTKRIVTHARSLEAETSLPAILEPTLAEAAQQAEARLAEVGRGWRELIARIDAGASEPLLLNTIDGAAGRWRDQTDGTAYGPVDMLDLWTVWLARQPEGFAATKRGVGAASLRTHRARPGSDATMVARWVDPARPTRLHKNPAQAADAGAEEDPHAHALAHNLDTARRVQRGRRRRRVTLMIALFVGLPALIGYGIYAAVTGSDTPDPTPASGADAGDTEPLSPAEQITAAAEEAIAASGDETVFRGVGNRLVVTAGLAGESGIQAYLRFCANRVSQADAPLATDPPPAAVISTFFGSDAVQRALGRLAEDGLASAEQIRATAEAWRRYAVAIRAPAIALRGD